MAEETKADRSSEHARPERARRLAQGQEEARKGAVTYRPSDGPRPPAPAASSPSKPPADPPADGAGNSGSSGDDRSS